MNIDIKDLEMRYSNGYRALKKVNIEIGDGMFGLLGPNGAGKSTLMQILVSLMKPSGGSITVNGIDLQKHRKEMRLMYGYLPQDFRFFPKLRSWEFLDYSARLAGMSNKSKRRDAVDEMLEEVGLYEVRERYANKLSGGMKRRLGIAQALIGDPKIIIVDEPTTGLDPDERIRFRNLLTKVSQRDVSIILSTHIVGDISSSCDNMALLRKGEVVFKGAPSQLIEEAKGHVFKLHIDANDYEKVSSQFNIITSIPTSGGWELELISDHMKGYDATIIDPNLEHAYVYFMEHKLETWNPEEEQSQLSF